MLLMMPQSGPAVMDFHDCRAEPPMHTLKPISEEILMKSSTAPVLAGVALAALLLGGCSGSASESSGTPASPDGSGSASAAPAAPTGSTPDGEISLDPEPTVCTEDLRFDFPQGVEITGTFSAERLSLQINAPSLAESDDQGGWCGYTQGMELAFEGASRR